MYVRFYFIFIVWEYTFGFNGNLRHFSRYKRSITTKYGIEKQILSLESLFKIQPRFLEDLSWRQIGERAEFFIKIKRRLTRLFRSESGDFSEKSAFSFLFISCIMLPVIFAETNFRQLFQIGRA
ncbi:hypothetical protein AZI98_11085 [Aeribacillus pallidus]|uniref:Uncharacterized protein n=1 Tax=Aeribacillus pallidus TaxID=33936 RepID=A0A165XGN1_9BACI|nr:hypothetical protein AZI98_11085 [Aeribacillus pallidus]